MADLTTIKKQVIDLLNANEHSGGAKVYSANSGDEDFLSDAISRAIDEAKTIVAERICKSESGLKSAFAQTQSITNGAQLPTHYGSIFNVKITPFDGASFTLKGQKRHSDLINSYRANPDEVYGEIAHDEEDTNMGDNVPSHLAGFYSDEDNQFEFTGHSATISYFDFTNVNLSSYPTSLEVPITHIAVGLMAKDGTVSDKFNEHMGIGLGLLGDAMKEG